MSKADTEKSIIAKLASLGHTVQAPVPDETAAAEAEPAPGSFKDDPEGAMRYIMSKATGQQLQPGSTPGSYTKRAPVDQPLLRLFGMKHNVPVTGSNYADTAAAANIGKFLPDGLPRTPDGRPMVDKESFMTALQAAQSFGPKKRADFFMSKGVDKTSGEPVTFNTANNTWYKGGKEVPADQVSRLLTTTVQNVPDAEVQEISAMNTRLSQIKRFAETFDPSSWGLVSGSLKKTIAQYTDSDPKRAEQYKLLYDLVADLVHQRYGSALTATETAQKVDSMMSKYQSPEAVKAFINTMAGRTQTERANRIAALKEQQLLGIDSLDQGAGSSFGQDVFGTSEPKTSTKTSKASAAARYQELLKSGLKKDQIYKVMAGEGY